MSQVSFQSWIFLVLDVLRTAKYLNLEGFADDNVDWFYISLMLGAVLHNLINSRAFGQHMSVSLGADGEAIATKNSKTCFFGLIDADWMVLFWYFIMLYLFMSMSSFVFLQKQE